MGTQGDYFYVKNVTTVLFNLLIKLMPMTITVSYYSKFWHESSTKLMELNGNDFLYTPTKFQCDISVACKLISQETAEYMVQKINESYQIKLQSPEQKKVILQNYQSAWNSYLLANISED